jgi:hypothetical protein
VTTTTVLLLVALWAVVLVPGAWRDRRSSPRSTVAGFTAAMQRLAVCDSRRVLVLGGPGRQVHPARSAQAELLERRRMVLVRLLLLELATFLTALVAGGWFWWTLFVLATAALGAYVAALRALELQRQRRGQVITLPSAARARDTARRLVAEAARVSADRSRAADTRRRDAS